MERRQSTAPVNYGQGGFTTDVNHLGGNSYPKVDIHLYIYIYIYMYIYIYIYRIDKDKPCDQNAQYNCRAKYAHIKMK